MPGTDVVRFAYHVVEPDFSSLPEIKLRQIPLSLTTGQYCFINIPAISVNQWHPFTISSLGNELLVTNHIKSMKKPVDAAATVKSFNDLVVYAVRLVRRVVVGEEKEWTESLLSIAKNIFSSYDAAAYESLVVNIDGPYGTAFHANHYKHILLVAGGIGITPMQAHFRSMCSDYGRQGLDTAAIESVKLVWVVRALSEALIFAKEVVCFKLSLYFSWTNVLTARNCCIL